MSITRIKFQDLGVNPENGKQRKRYIGYMTDAEYINFILGLAAGATDDLDDGAEIDLGDQQSDLWDDLQALLSTPDGDGYGQD